VGKGNTWVIFNGVAMGWTRSAKSRRPECRRQRVPGKIKEKLLSRYSELDHLNIKPVFTLYERVVHVGETCNRFADIGCDCELHKMRSVTGLRPDPLRQL